MRPTALVAAAVLSAVVVAAQPQATPPPVPGVQQTPGPRSPAQPAAPVRDTAGRPPAAPPGTSVLTGTVTTFGGQPAAGARVTVSGEGPPRTTVTDVRGHFAVTALRAKTKSWRPIYEHYRAKGPPTTAALVILARRIARTAWSIYTHKTDFDPKRLTKALT